MMNRTLAVDTSTMQVYDYLRDGETHDNLLKRAEMDRAKDIATWERHSKNYPNSGYESRLAALRKKSYQVMTCEEFALAERNFYINRPMTEITEERYYDMLNVLPPRCWTTLRGVEMFCMSEMLTGTYTDQYAKVGDKYYNKIVDIIDRSTWIHNALDYDSHIAGIAET